MGPWPNQGCFLGPWGPTGSHRGGAALWVFLYPKKDHWSVFMGGGGGDLFFFLYTQKAHQSVLKGGGAALVLFFLYKKVRVDLLK